MFTNLEERRGVENNGRILVEEGYFVINFIIVYYFSRLTAILDFEFG